MIARTEKIIDIALKIWLFLFCFGLSVITFDCSGDMIVTMLYALIDNFNIGDIFYFLKGGRPDDPTNFVN